MTFKADLWRKVYPKEAGMRQWVSVAWVGALLALLGPLGGRAEGKPTVFVSIAPQQYFVGRIAGESVAVQVMVPPGSSPATYEPRPRQMAALARAKAYFALGVPFERTWLSRFVQVNRRMRLVHTDRDVAKVPIEGHAGHAPGGPPDPHIWLSPPLVMLQAREILQGLVSVDRGHRDVYETGYRRFITDLVGLDRSIMGLFGWDEERLPLMVMHPAWGYFARAYGLRQVAVEHHGKPPKPAQLKRLIETARQAGVKALFAAPQQAWKSARAIAEAMGVELLEADPLAPNWSENLRLVAARFAAATSKQE